MRLHLRGLRYGNERWLEDAHPFNVPAVRHIQSHGLRFTAPVTFFVGENGAGKTTVLESIAVRYPRVGAATPFLARTGTELSLEDAPLGWNAELETSPNAAADGFFLRASTLDALTQTLESETRGRAGRNARGAASENASYRARSHGEGLLNVLQRHFDERGFYLMDEPETALSFQSTLSVVALLHGLARTGSQVICATHSPLLLSLPGAQTVEFGEWGIRETNPEELELMRDWRSFLEHPENWLRHLLNE
jgi:predicted ATPase